MKRLLSILFALLLVVQTGAITPASAVAPAGTIVVIINPTMGGTATYTIQENEVSITPAPQPGYQFEKWSYTVNAVEKPETNINPLYIQATELNTTIVATPHFVKEVYMITASAGPGGSVTGGGQVEAGAHYTLTATPYSGYEFDKWTENGADVPNSPGASFYGIAEQNHNYLANFKGLTHTVSATVDPAGSGTVNTQVSYSGTFEYATAPTAALTAQALAGYAFDGWYENGNKISSSASEVFDTNRDRTLVAKFVSASPEPVNPDPVDPDPVTPTSSPDVLTKYTITYKPGSNSAPGSTAFSTEWYAGNVYLLGQYYSRQGFTQTGWSETDGGGKSYDLNAQITLNRNLTLYPYWEKVSIDLWLTVDIGQGGGVRLSGGNVPNGWTGKLSPNTSFTFYLYPNQGNYVYRIGLAGWHYPIQSGNSFTVTYEMMQGRNQTLVIRFADARSHPPTGDDSQIALWSALGIMSFSAIIILTAKRKKKQ